VSNAFADDMELAATILGQQKPQQNEDDDLLDKGYIKADHGL
jgi:hypothetical protein